MAEIVCTFPSRRYHVSNGYNSCLVILKSGGLMRVWIACGCLSATSVACHDDAPTRGDANGEFFITSSSGSSVNSSPFIVDTAAVNVNGSAIQVIFVTTGGERSLRLDLDDKSQIVTGALFDMTIEYFESPGVSEQWITDPNQTNSIAIEFADDVRFAFRVTDHDLVPSGPDATGTLTINGSGEGIY